METFVFSPRQHGGNRNSPLLSSCSGGAIVPSPQVSGSGGVLTPRASSCRASHLFWGVNCVVCLTQVVWCITTLLATRVKSSDRITKGEMPRYFDGLCTPPHAIDSGRRLFRTVITFDSLFSSLSSSSLKQVVLLLVPVDNLPLAQRNL